MEKIAIVSDVHANLTAWNAFLEDSKKRGVSRIFCLGDIVFKGCSPAEVIDSVRANCEVIVQGNCDEHIASESAKKYWSRQKIGEERAAFLRSLPLCHEFYMSGYFIRLFHASPSGILNMYNPMYSNKNSKYAEYEIDKPEELFVNTAWLGKSEADKVPDIIGYGHIHTPNILRFRK